MQCVNFCFFFNAYSAFYSKFDAKLYENDFQFESCVYRKIALNVFCDSLRYHYDMVRKNGKSKIMNDKTYRYFESLYKVIHNELAKAFFRISLFGNHVYYYDKDKDDIIEVEETQIKYYSLANFNYILLVNIIHTVINSDITIDDNMVEIVAAKYQKNIQNLKKRSKYQNII